MTRTTVLLVPGRMLGPHVPLLYYAGEAAEARGATVEALHWPGHPAPEVLDADVAARVGDRVRDAVERLDPGRVLVVAKSLGTMAAPVARDLGLPAVWLTPVMTGAVGTDASVFNDAVASRTAPALLVGGTADQLWDSDRAHRLGAEVVEVAGADHSMMVPGPLAGSLAVLTTVVAAVERFLDQHL